MVGFHHWLNGHEFEQALGDSDGQGSLVCCSPWGRKELDRTERLNSNNLKCVSELSSGDTGTTHRPLSSEACMPWLFLSFQGWVLSRSPCITPQLPDASGDIKIPGFSGGFLAHLVGLGGFLNGEKCPGHWEFMPASQGVFQEGISGTKGAPTSEDRGDCGGRCWSRQTPPNYTQKFLKKESAW